MIFFNPSGRKIPMVQSIRVTGKTPFRVDASFESGEEFSYDIINAPTQNCAIIFNQAYFQQCLNLSSAELCQLSCYSQFDGIN